MSNTKRRFKRAQKKLHQAAKMSIEQMIEAGYFVPPKGDLEQGKTYVAQVTHDHGCPLPDGGGTCTCREVQVEYLEHLAEGKVDA